MEKEKRGVHLEKVTGEVCNSGDLASGLLCTALGSNSLD